MTTRPDSDSRVRAWLGRAFMLQVALISFAAVVGVSQMHVSRLLRRAFEQMREWLDDEASLAP